MLDFKTLAKQLKIGDTALMKFPSSSAEIFVKQEQENFSGSIKARPVLNMIVTAINQGKLKTGGTIVEATSGNTGIALAAICRQLGFSVLLTMPETMSLERRKILTSLGAKLVLTSGSLGMAGAILEAERLAQTIPNALQIRQFENTANPQSHYISTAEELLAQLNQLNKIPHAIVAGVGTGGTLCGTAKRLLEVFKNLEVFAVEPAESAVLSGKRAGAHQIEGIGAGFLPKTTDPSIFTDIISVPSQQALQTAKELNFSYNFDVGISSGANIFACKMLAKYRLKNKVIITFFADKSDRYSF